MDVKQCHVSYTVQYTRQCHLIQQSTKHSQRREKVQHLLAFVTLRDGGSSVDKAGFLVSHRVSSMRD